MLGENPWSVQLIKASFENHILAEILSIRVSTQTAKDHLVWMGTQSGRYSVKMGYIKILAIYEGRFETF